MPENFNRIVKLKDICTHKNVENQSDFVGLRYNKEQKKFFIDFPIGFSNSKYEESADEKQKERLLRKDILTLFKVLSRYELNSQTQKAAFLSEKTKNELPIYAYLNVIDYFLKYGYYRQRECCYKIQKQGKISWNKTIKKVSPIVSKKSIIYLDFVTKKESPVDNELLSIINRFCVYEAFKNTGCLFTSFIPKDPHIKCREKLFTFVLKAKITKTFNDKDRLLFLNMLDIVRFSSKKHNGSNFFFGTNEFHVIFEKMVDEKFGILPKDKKSIYPHISWKLFNKNTATITPLIPDTIMIPDSDGSKIYILDSKYYKYSYTHQSSDQPLAESVPKQIAYGDKVKLCCKDKDVYNAFILPANGSQKDSAGFVFADWKNKQELFSFPHNRIQEIFIDTRDLMYDHSKANTEELLGLAKIIEEGAKKSLEWLKSQF